MKDTSFLREASLILGSSRATTPLPEDLLRTASLRLRKACLWYAVTYFLAYFPFFLLMGAGIALSNTLAVGRALARKPEAFRRTPKFHLQSGRDRWTSSAYALPIERTTWGELALAAYATLAGVLALRFGPELVPLYALYALGFGYVGALGVGQASRVRSARRSAPALGSLARMDVRQ